MAQPRLPSVMVMEEVTHGGDVKNIEHGVEEGVEKDARKVWAWGHDDQRASWLMHFLICAGGSSVPSIAAVLLGAAPARVVLIYAVAAFGMWCVFMAREAGDEDYWRKRGKWDAIDRDRSWLGKLRLGVTRRFDKIGDLTGPSFNMLTAWIVYGLLRWAS